ncbi:hypothetical protein, partial [Lysinibacillus sp. UBA5990]|uniref:hypothetical protein n=1 Tax=Lysinibacillus sp. UBA5990 TaxID=1946773 RepID=UPI0025B8F218
FTSKLATKNFIDYGLLAQFSRVMFCFVLACHRGDLYNTTPLFLKGQHFSEKKFNFFLHIELLPILIIKINL